VRVKFFFYSGTAQEKCVKPGPNPVMSLFEVPGVTDTPMPDPAKAANAPVAEVATEAVADVADADDDTESQEETDAVDSQDAAAFSTE
jgi:hypothetical protein